MKIQYFLFVLLGSFAANAATWVYENGTVSDGNWVITSQVDQNSGKLTIKKYLEGEGVLDLSTISEDTSTTSLVIGSDCFYDGTDSNPLMITGLVLPDTLTAIERRAFRGCNNLGGPLSCNGTFQITGGDAFAKTAINSVNFPNIFGTIPTWTFQDCSNMTSVVLSQKVTGFGSAFGGCKSLVSLTPLEYPLVTELSNNGIFQDKKITGVISFPNVVSVAGLVFHSSGFSEILLPKCSSIGDSAFYRSAAERIQLAPIVTNIVKHAFGAASNLKTIEVKEYHLSVLNQGLFSSSDNIEGVLDFSKSTFIELPKEIFMKKDKLDRIILPETLQYVNEKAFERYVDTELVFLGEQPEFLSQNVFYSGAKNRVNLVVHEKNLSSWTNAASGVTYTSLADVDESEKTEEYYFPQTNYARTIGKLNVCGRDLWLSLLNEEGTIIVIQ